MTGLALTEVNSKLAAEENVLRNIRDRVNEILTPYCEDHDYLYRSRIKSAVSISEKIETGRFEKWSEIDDLFACSIIVIEPKSINHVLKFLRNKFEEVATKQKHSTKKPPSEFRFDATRFYGRIKSDTGVAPDADIRRLTFEVQIPTLLDYSWQKLTRKIAYKQNSVDWKLLRISAHLRANIEQMEIIASNPKRFRNLVPESSWPEIQSKASILNYFREVIESQDKYKAITPESWSRFGDNFYSLSMSFYDTPLTNSNVMRRTNSKLKTIQNWLASGNEFPSSLSLISSCTGILVEDGGKMPDTSLYRAHLGPTLSSFFPGTSLKRSQFEFD